MKSSFLLLLLQLFLTATKAAAGDEAWHRRPLSLPNRRETQKDAKKPSLVTQRGGKKELVSGTSSFGASIFNLVNNVAGAGILALAAGQAKGTGWIPSIALCAVLGMISARTFTMIGEACELTGQQDFKVSRLHKTCTYYYLHLGDSVLTAVLICFCFRASGPQPWVKVRLILSIL
jgi:hypothetical protein